MSWPVTAPRRSRSGASAEQVRYLRELLEVFRREGVGWEPKESFHALAAAYAE